MLRTEAEKEWHENLSAVAFSQPPHTAAPQLNTAIQTTTPLSNSTPNDALPASSKDQVERFISTIQHHKGDEKAMTAILKLISADKSVHQKLEVGLLNLSLEADDKISNHNNTRLNLQ